MDIQDFPPADAIYEPTDGLVLGLPPLMLALLVILLAAAAVLGWWFGQSHGDGKPDADAPEEIHKAILAASAAAMAASSNDLKSKAQALRDLIAELLGPVLDFAKGVAPPLKALDEALKGEVATEPKPAAETRPSCACGKPEACVCKGPTAVTVNQVYIGGATTQAGCGCPGPGHKSECAHAKPEAPKPEAKPGVRPMSGPEQIDALSKAVRQFHDHWLNGPARIKEMTAARAALSRRPPASPKSHGSHAGVHH